MATAVRGVVGVGLVVVLGGCWPAPGAGPDRRSHNPLEARITVDTVQTLAPAWNVPLDHGGAGTPVVSTAGVHLTDGQAVYGFDARTGARRWKVPAAPEVFEGMGQPVAVRGRLLVGHGDTGGRYYETQWLDAATGAATQAPVSGGHVDGVRSPLVLLRSVSYGSLTDVGIGFDVTNLDDPTARSGGLIEVHESGGGAGLPLTLGRRRVYHAGPGMPGPDVPEPPDRWIPGVRAFPVTGGTSTCGPPVAPYFACPLWATELDGAPTTPPVLSADESTVYVGTEPGTLYALDTARGDVLWQAPVGGAPTDAPALADGTLFVPVTGDRLAVLPAGGCGAATCAVSWTAALGGRGQQPAVAGGVVFVGTAGGTIEAVPAAGCGEDTCQPVWSYDVGAPVTGDPAVSRGRLLVGTSAGRLLAFTPRG